MTLLVRGISGRVDEPGYAHAIENAGLPADLPWRVTVSSRRQTVGLTAEPGGMLTIRVPEGAPAEQVTRTIARRMPWIARATGHRADVTADHPVKELIDGENFPFLGRNRQLIVTASDSGIRLDGDRLLAFPRVSAADIIDWYARAGLDWLTQRAPQYCSRIGVALPGLNVRDLGNRWGTCTAGNALRMSLHWALFQMSPPLINLVIVHELAHLIHSKHGTGFERLVEQVIPGYHDRLTGLTEHGRHVWMGEVSALTTGTHLRTIRYATRRLELWLPAWRVILAQAGAVVSGSEESRTTLAGELLDRFPEINVYRGDSAGTWPGGSGDPFGGGQAR